MSVLSELSRELQTLVARTAPAVVGVEHRRGQGSGVLLAGDGYLATNAHVVGRARAELRALLESGERVPARLVGRDEASDLALLRLDSGVTTSLPLAPDGALEVGQLVVAIGSPFYLQRSVSLGVVSAVDRSLANNPAGLMEGLIQTDAAINPGNSGGPLLDVEGRVVGINTAAIPYAQGIGFAIPARTLSWVVPILLQKGEVRRPWLGISARSVSLPTVAVSQGERRRGIRVLDVAADSPAKRAGLRSGDVILSANQRWVAFVDDLQRELVYTPGPVALGILREQALRTLDVTPVAWPAAA